MLYSTRYFFIGDIFMSEVMNIRNRMHDIIKLRSNAMQDFLHLSIKQEWKNDFYNKLEIYHENKIHPEIYSEPYDKIRSTNLDNYDIKDMDVTLISAILIYNKDLLQYKPTNRVIEVSKQLREDRNLTQHSSENEEDDELYLRALLSLCNIRTFVRVADKDSNIPESEKKKGFRQNYEKRIADLMETIDDERFELISKYKKFKKDLNRILKETDKTSRWKVYSNICDSYKSMGLTDHDYRKQEQEFGAYAYENGLDCALFDAAMYYVVFVKNFKKYNAIYSSKFQNMIKEEKDKNIEIIKDYLQFVYFFKKEKDFETIMEYNLKIIKQLGIEIEKNENGNYSISE